MVRTRGSNTPAKAEKEELIEPESPKVSKRKSRGASTPIAPVIAAIENDDDDAPEVVTSSDASIQYLKQLHESAADSFGKAKRKKRPTQQISVDSSSKRSKTFSKDEELDMEVLEALDSELPIVVAEEKEKESTEVGESKKNKKKSKDTGFKINKHKTATKFIDNLEVTVVDTGRVDPTAEFAMSASASAFLATMGTSQPRVSYSTFAAQRKPGPALKFKR